MSPTPERDPREEALLQPGTTLGPYEVREKIGAGGMGEVYRGRDARLGREVALKVLPASTMGDSATRARFFREAQAASRLNHPHIVTVFDIGETGGRVFLAMEYVAGRTLSDLIPQRGMPLDEALRYALPIAAALSAAHDAGIVHRDLKPGNVMVTVDGVVKVLDFGLARLTGAQDGEASQPTVSATGLVVGTPQYMAPEQAQGKRVDRRADIWAFGVLFYEMLTGRRPFQRETVADTLAAILTAEPDWQAVPPRSLRLLRRCLEKDPQRRLRDIGDIADLLDSVPEAPSPRARGPWQVATALLSVALLATAYYAWRSGRPAERPFTRLNVSLGPEAVKALDLTAAISPDGRRLVFSSRAPDGTPQLATRLLDQDQPTLLPGTQRATDPFFSPDGQWVGFFADRQLRKVSVNGGAPVTICATGGPRGASWGEDGQIVGAFNALEPLQRVSDAGGTPQPITKLGVGEGSHRWPQVLPGGIVLFTATAFNIGSDNGRIEALSLKTGKVTILPLVGYSARYLPSGHLVYVHQNTLFAVAFDPNSLEVRGAPAPILEDLAANPMTGGGQFAFSGAASGGTFVYLAGKGASERWRMMWLDSAGHVQPLNAAPGTFTNPRVSPDGRKIALLDGTDLYVYDLERETTTRLVSGQVTMPTWSPDGKHIMYLSVSGGHAISWIRSDGAGQAVRLLESPNFLGPWSIAPDGRVAYNIRGEGTADDIWTLPLDLTDPDHPKPGKPEPFLVTPEGEGGPRFSPDGHWMAYQADQSGRTEVYVRAFPPGNGQWKISVAGGHYPCWSGKSHELYYQSPDSRIMVVSYSIDGGAFVPGKARVWYDKPIFTTGGVPNADISPDGNRFLIFAPVEASPEPAHVTMLFNFFDELRRRVR